MTKEEILEIEKSMSSSDWDRYVEILWGMSNSSRWGAYHHATVEEKEKTLKRLKDTTE